MWPELRKERLLMKTGQFFAYIKSKGEYGSKGKNRILLMALIGFLLLFFASAVTFFVYRNVPALSRSAVDSRGEESTAENITENSTETDTAASVAAAAVTSGTTAGAAPVDEKYYDDACFIGDSRSEGFMQYSGPAKATYYVYKGLTVDAAFTKAFINDNGSKVTVAAALKNHRFGKVYIMLGINELGWQYSSMFYDKYSKLIDVVKSTQPDAKIFVQSIFPVTAARSANGDYVNNRRIQEYDTLIQTMCAEKKLVYLDIGEAVLDSNGNLPDEAAYDGVHLKKPYCDKWRAYLDTHTDVPVATMPVTTAEVTAAGNVSTSSAG